MVTIKEITSRDEWDAFLYRHSPNALFQSWLWGNLQVKLNVPIWRFGLYEGDMLRGVALIIKVAARRGTFLHIRHGPILDTTDKELWKWYFGEMKNLAKKEDACFVRINPLIENSSDRQKLFRLLGLVPAAIHAMDAEYTWVLPLDKNEDALLPGMRKSTRYEIRRAISAGVSVEKTTDPGQLKCFFRLYDETMKRQDFVPPGGIAEEFELFAKEGKAMLLLGSHQNRISAAAIILFDGNQAIYHYGASVRSDAGVSSLVQWEAIKEANNRGCLLYNFWGIAPDDKKNHPWRGITLFKTGFGGHVAESIHAHDLPVSPFYVIPRAIETWRRWRKGY
mgnify:CR=1 FL=1